MLVLHIAAAQHAARDLFKAAHVHAPQPCVAARVARAKHVIPAQSHPQLHFCSSTHPGNSAPASVTNGAARCMRAVTQSSACTEVIGPAPQPVSAPHGMITDPSSLRALCCRPSSEQLLPTALKTLKYWERACGHRRCARSRPGGSPGARTRPRR